MVADIGRYHLLMFVCHELKYLLIFSANNANYACDFENAMQCGISQVTHDKGEFLMMNGSYLSKAILYQEAFNEHTNNDPNGMNIEININLEHV